jgi:preprotein translocase subunit SecG
MQEVILILHLIIAMALVGAVLMQRSEGGALGIGGGGGSLITGRGAADLMVNITGGLGAAFFITSISLTILAGAHRNAEDGIDRILKQTAPLTRALTPQPNEATAAAPIAAAPLAETESTPNTELAAATLGAAAAAVAPAIGPDTPRAGPLPTAPATQPIAAAAPRTSQPAASLLGGTPPRKLAGAAPVAAAPKAAGAPVGAAPAKAVTTPTAAGARPPTGAVKKERTPAPAPPPPAPAAESPQIEPPAPQPKQKVGPDE